KEYPARKDYTDSELALSVALDQAGPGDKVVILGGLGGRLDHTLSNIFLLLRGEKENVDVLLCDGFNEVQLIRGP
ncbi:MAG TPA: thiamine diphosphokinase, partial [Lachnospiraceae bacterium]|nr:thiamine diphosphokinase [Lachnospiraceae bacterium]